MSELARSASFRSAPTRRTLAGLAAGAAVLVVLAAAREIKDGSRSTAGMPAPKPDAAGQVTREETNRSAEVTARTFVSSYVSFLYGRRTADGVAPVADALRRELLEAQFTPTPAELSRAVVVRDLAVAPRTGSTATADAVIDDGASPPYALSFNLSFSHRLWVVTGVQKGDR